MIEGVDSFYQAFKARVVSINPLRLVNGLMNAQDWPPKDVLMDTFYVLVLGFAPNEGSASAVIVGHQLQIVWMNKGTDVQAGIKGRNRGDRYRISFEMQEEVLQGLYPYLTEKKSWSVNAQNNLVGASMNPVEYIFWSRPRMIVRTDQASGLVYGSAAVSLTNITDQITA